MALGKWVLGSAVLLMTGSMLIAADEPMTVAPSTQPAEKRHMKKLPKPWSLLKSLTPEQTAQIEKIHGDALEQTKKIDQKEEDDITALLTPDQKTELEADEAKQKADPKGKKKQHMATTEPA